MNKMRATTINKRTNSKGQVIGTKHNTHKTTKNDHTNYDITQHNGCVIVLYNEHNDDNRCETFLTYDDYDENTITRHELEFYRRHFEERIKNQNERNNKSRHSERNSTIFKYFRDEKSCPEETILQVGKTNKTITPKDLIKIWEDFEKEYHSRYGKGVKTLDVSFHFDEGVPHIHWRKVYLSHNKKGEEVVSQSSCLRDLNIELEGKENRYNNRKKNFDSQVRELFFDVCEEHGFNMERVPQVREGNKTKKQEQWRNEQLHKKNEELERQNNTLENDINILEDELNYKLNTLVNLDNLSDEQLEQILDIINNNTQQQTNEDEELFFE